MAKWSFLTNHARALLCIAHDPGVRLREIAVALDITERSAHNIVSEVIEVGYVIKDKQGHRNHYEIQ
jgi:DNA-binding IclR family transcriptional regulator